MLNVLLVFFLCALGAYLGFGLFLYLRQRQLQYQPTHRDKEGLGNNTFKPWRAETGGQFLGYIRPAQNSPKRVLVFFHGNAGEALDRAWVADLVLAADCVILAEYPGYGARSGKPTEAGLLEDARNLITQIQSQWSAPIIAMGESLGAAIAMKLAAEGRVTQVALVAAFPSGSQIAAQRYPFFPVKWLLKDRYEALGWIRESKIPLHQVHGTLDEYVPLEQARALYQAAATEDKTIDEVPGFGHNNLPDALLHSPFTARFREFLTQNRSYETPQA